ncbi:D-lactate dehydrogenase cytochrome oxidoreductase [Suillus fuscotomentosus]|uniref:D-lactate dehydrogenase (cytochrome) n=1 Tax=Suillus fuscotomentosus TaxID=1912939 RepID=A0AAD4DY70_9AGAM|nr:D-lactate dehydrogenase cytochrome oxidoreductase [Suillus fuscotomentosus]KAG1894813.1 D-lactate dehydrogenase cytochrome oxidoreductase [Suillus fuscotomentosus]
MTVHWTDLMIILTGLFYIKYVTFVLLRGSSSLPFTWHTMFHLSMRVLVARGYHFSLRSSCIRSCRASYHHSSSSGHTTQKDVLRIGEFVLGSLLAMGTSYYIFQYREPRLVPARLETGATTTIHTTSSELGELSLAHLQRSGSGELSSAGGAGDITDAFGSSSFSTSTYGSPEDVQKAIEELRDALPGKNRVQTSPDSLRVHGSSDHSYHPSCPHSVVVMAYSTDDVVKVVNISRKYKVPIIALGGATSIEGHFTGFPSGSICLDLSAMNSILEINEADGDLRCQPGAKWEDINNTLKDRGIPLFFPLDPGPGATIGGMIGTGCSGTNAVRYGTAKAEWFLNITVVLPSGKVIKTRRRARKSSAGFDTTKLFIGAEGTLGIVTEATLRLAPRVPTKVAMAQFPDVEKAVSAVQQILNTPHGPHIQCVELLDDHMMAAINTAGLVDAPYPVQDTLFFKIQGSPESIRDTSNVVQEIVQRHGSTRFEFAATEEEAGEMWENRKYALFSTLATQPGSKIWTTDVCVPVSRLPQLVYETKEDLAKAGLKSTIVGHVGDGNFHALILFKDEEELRSVGEAVHRLVHRAIQMDGTCTGEHGVGVGKTEYLVEELGEDTVELMKTVKNAIDPLNLFNPGKLYPENNKDKTQMT